MKTGSNDNANRGDELPTVSSPTLHGEAAHYVPPPQIEGYEIISELGEAGQGRVWRARQLSTRREVALKVPRVDLLTSRKTLSRFEREVELAARLTHPNIAAIYDSGIYQGLYYYAMELIAGIPLDEYTKQHAPTERQIMELMRTICGAIQHAHQNGVIHRDIKSSNIIVTKDGQPHMVDFGLAMSILQSDASRSISIDGEVTGTPAYMSPEQATGHHDQLDTRTDIYSIGVVFYKVLTNQFPYDVKTSILETLRNIQGTEPTRPSRIIPRLNSDIEAIVLKALAKNPSDRYQSVAELQHDIERWLNGLPILAKADNSVYMLRKLLNKHRYTTAVVALLLIIIFGYGSFSLQLYGKLREAIRNVDILRESLEDERERTAEITRLESFGRVLWAWQEGDRQTVNAFAAVSQGSPREDVATRFIAAEMLDDAPLPEKIKKLDDALKKYEPYFRDFIAAEYYFKNDNRPEAEQAYRRCLSSCTDTLPDRWLAVRTRSRLYELTAAEHAEETSSPAKEAEQ